MSEFRLGVGRYALAVALVAVALVVRWPLAYVVGDMQADFAFMPAIMVVALLGGAGPGVLATLLSALAVAWFLPPVDSFRVAAVSDLLSLAEFAAIGVFMTVVAELYHRARERGAVYQRELAVRQSEDRYRRLVESSPDAVFINRDDRIEFANAAALRLFGAAIPEQVLGRSPLEFQPPDYHALIRGRIHRQLTEGQPVPLLEEKVVRLDGTLVDVEIAASPFDDQHGRAIQVIVRDITQRKRAEAALRDASRQWQGTFDALAEAVWVLDTESRIQQCNKAAEAMFHLPAGPMIGRYCWELVHGHHPHPDCPWRRAQHSRRRESMELAVGSTWYLVTVDPLSDQHGELCGAVHILSDITDRKRVELELAQAKSAAEAANRAKSEFLANMSHEIRTPMTAILGFADLLASGGTNEAERADYVEIIQRNGRVLLQLINDILDLSKIEAGKMTVEHIECSPWTLMEEVLAVTRIRAEEKGLALAVDYQYPLPQTIQTDPIRLRQILVNLVGNAVKFTERGRVQVTVSFTPSNDVPAALRFAVRDTGIGISPAGREKLFQPLTQVDNSHTRRFGGTGLGLAVSQRLAALLDGDITVESRLGEGSTFTLSIGVGPLDHTPILTARPEFLSAEASAVGSEQEMFYGHVLVAEDAPDSQSLLRVVLQHAGLTVDIAENGSMACTMAGAAVAEGRPYDLILMDAQMPHMTGYEATRRLRSYGWQGPIVALTAHAMAGDRQKCLAAGCDDYLAKPATRASLFALLRRYLKPRVLNDAPHGSASPTAVRLAASDTLREDDR